MNTFNDDFQSLLVDYDTDIDHIKYKVFLQQAKDIADKYDIKLKSEYNKYIFYVPCINIKITMFIGYIFDSCYHLELNVTNIMEEHFDILKIALSGKHSIDDSIKHSTAGKEWREMKVEEFDFICWDLINNKALA